MLWAVTLLFVLGALSLPLVHEGGHALAALVVGGKRLRLERRGALHFVTSADLPPTASAARLFYGAGPAANLVFALVLALVPFLLSLQAPLLVSVVGIAAVHVLFGVVNLLPLEGHDGRALLKAQPDLATAGEEET